MSRDWLEIAKNIHASSTSYVDSNYRKKWDDSLRMFRSRHPSDSKYNSDTYQHRSKLFRPKSRSLVRKTEAAVAAAFFSNQDVLSTSAVNDDDVGQAASASLMKEILQYRLTKSIPWFQLVCGGIQDAMVMGVVCSYQYWKYREKEIKGAYKGVVAEDGSVSYVQEVSKKIIDDKPCVELIPVENIRFDPAADWTNPAQTSPYVIRLIPMYVCDLKSQMEDGDEETGMRWKKLSDGQIRSAQRKENDQTRQTREQNRQDSTDTGNAPLTDFEVVWVHENFVRIDGEEVVFYTLGTEFMLSKVRPLEDVYFHGERPIVIGCCMIETHVSMPESPVMMAEQLQREANEIANQRMDNVKLVLNKRYVVKRGSDVDLRSLIRNVPASITMANNPIEDVRTLEYQDVTGSSYAEQDRINVDYDELTGNFSQGSVMTNRKMGETVGGMGMISNAANQITEYSIRTFAETWVEPVLRQLANLEQKYETDEVVLAIAAGKAKLLQKYGVNAVTDELLNKELTLTVNVGMGATNPDQKLGRYIGALSAYANAAQMQIPNANMAEIGKEIFSLAGYRDGARFVGDGAAPQVPIELQQQMQAMQQQLQQAMQQLDQAKAGHEMEMHKLQAEMEIEQQKLAQKDRETLIKIESEMALAELDNETKIQLKQMDITGGAIEQRIN